MPLRIADGIQSESADPSNRRYICDLRCGGDIFIYQCFVVHAFPAQRYLLFVLPLAYCFCPARDGEAEADSRTRNRCEHCA